VGEGGVTATEQGQRASAHRPDAPRAAPPADVAVRVLAAIGTDPTQAYVLLDAGGRARWASPSLPGLFALDLTAPDPFRAALHPDDLALVDEVYRLERAGRADESVGMDRRFELLVRLRSPAGEWRWVAVRLHNRLDDPVVDGMVLQLTLANQEHATVEAFDAAAAGEPTDRILAHVLATLCSGGSSDAHAVVFDTNGWCLAASPGAGIGAGSREDTEAWQRMSSGRVDLTVPVTGPRGTAHGTLVLTSSFPDVRPFTRSLAHVVARRVGLVLDAAHDREVLRWRAETDPLTGLRNRRSLLDHLDRDDVAPFLAVAFVDLDRFKEINDRLGHHVGDEILATVARRLRHAARPDDVVARVGGDEFVLVREGHSPEACSLDADALAAELARPLEAGGRPVEVSVSVGVATGVAAVRHRLLPDADHAMYRHKASRRGPRTAYAAGAPHTSSFDDPGARRRAT
jgi:diguanylate cyclase (GGDEF)-like protein